MNQKFFDFFISKKIDFFSNVLFIPTIFKKIPFFIDFENLFFLEIHLGKVIFLDFFQN